MFCETVLGKAKGSVETALVTLCALGYSERLSIRARPGGVSVLLVSIMKVPDHLCLRLGRLFHFPLKCRHDQMTVTD